MTLIVKFLHFHAEKPILIPSYMKLLLTYEIKLGPFSLLKRVVLFCFRLR